MTIHDGLAKRAGERDSLTALALKSALKRAFRDRDNFSSRIILVINVVPRKKKLGSNSRGARIWKWLHFGSLPPGSVSATSITEVCTTDMTLSSRKGQKWTFLFFPSSPMKGESRFAVTEKGRGDATGR